MSKFESKTTHRYENEENDHTFTGVQDFVTLIQLSLYTDLLIGTFMFLWHNGFVNITTRKIKLPRLLETFSFWVLNNQQDRSTSRNNYQGIRVYSIVAFDVLELQWSWSFIYILYINITIHIYMHAVMQIAEHERNWEPRLTIAEPESIKRGGAR